MGSLPYIADFDSSAAMVQALGRFLHGGNFPGLGLPPAIQAIQLATNLLPRSLRKRVYAFGGWVEAVRPERLRSFRADVVARAMVDLYPRRRYPALMVGSSNGALTHLCAALSIPWLPQTYLIPVHHRGLDPDEPCRGLDYGARWAPSLLQANPELQLHHMHDANQDRLMIQHMTYFRVKRRQLGRIYADFIADCLEPNGTIFIVECRLDWPVARLGRRHVFQHGGYGGAEPEEYLHGGPRVTEYLQRHRADKRHWVSPEPDGRAPEAEWGFAEPLGTELEDFARRHGYRVVHIVFDRPEHVSPLVADLYRWWYAQRGIGGECLIADSFILMDPWWTLRLGAVPFWCVFPVESSFDALKNYLDSRPPFERVHITLFAHGIESIGLVPVERWRALLARGNGPGSLLGVDERAFPADFAVFARYSPSLRRLPRRVPMPEPLTLRQLAAFLDETAGRYAVAWQDTV